MEDSKLERAEQSAAAAEKATPAEVKMSRVDTASDAEKAFVFSDEQSTKVIRQVTSLILAQRHSRPRLKMHA